MSVWDGIRLRVDTYEGVTNAQGQFAVTYPNAFSKRPSVTPAMVGAPSTRTIRVISSTLTGFVVQADDPTTQSILGFSVITSATQPVQGQDVTVTVAEIP